jgi:hypothetical protein
MHYSMLHGLKHLCCVVGTQLVATPLVTFDKLLLAFATESAGPTTHKEICSASKAAILKQM